MQVEHGINQATFQSVISHQLLTVPGSLVSPPVW